MVKFGYTIFYVRDVSKAVSFYENAFNFKRKFISPENDYAEIATGETTLSFASFTLAQTNLSTGFIESDLKNKAFGTEIGLVTENVEDVVKSALSAGAVLLEKPKKKPWGQVVAYIRDPDGFLIEICTPVSPS